MAEKQKDTGSDFMNKQWRPMMAMTYMAINICDFILFPILWSVVQFWETEAANDAFRQWVPMTLQSGGLIHMAFGAILGISAWGRTEEKMSGVNDVQTPVLDSTPPPYTPPPFTPPAAPIAETTTVEEPVQYEAQVEKRKTPMRKKIT